MNLLIAAVYVNTGIGKNPPHNPYSIPQAVVLNEFQPVNSKNFQSNGSGLTSVELAVSNDFFPTFQQAFFERFVDMPVYMDCKTALDREGRNIITGFLSASSAASFVPPVTSAEPANSFAGAKLVK